MKVSVSGKQFVFPRSCACCGAYPLTSLAVSGSERNRKARTRGWIFDVPYCVTCKQHVRATEGITLLSLALAAIALIFGYVSAALSGQWIFGLQIGLFLLISSGLICGALLYLIRAKLLVNCTRLTRSVIYLGSNGSCHSFDIRSRFYASNFVLDNHRKLVNASPQVVSILKGTRFGDFQVPRRILKKKSERF